MGGLGGGGSCITMRTGKTSLDLNFVWSPVKGNLVEKLTLM